MLRNTNQKSLKKNRKNKKACVVEVATKTRLNLFTASFLAEHIRFSARLRSRREHAFLAYPVISLQDKLISTCSRRNRSIPRSQREPFRILRA